MYLSCTVPAKNSGLKSGIDEGELFDEYNFQKKGNDRGVRKKQGAALDKLEQLLSKTKAERSETLTAMLLAEEVTGRMLFDEKQKVFLTVSQFFEDVTLQITHLGEVLDPLEDSFLTEKDTQEFYRSRILNAYRGLMSYNRRNRRNIVTITVHTSANRQMRYTILLTGRVIKENRRTDTYVQYSGLLAKLYINCI